MRLPITEALQERQGAAADLARARIDRDQARPVSTLSPSSNPQARPQPARWPRPRSASIQPKPRCTPPNKARKAAMRRPMCARAQAALAEAEAGLAAARMWSQNRAPCSVRRNRLQPQRRALRVCRRGQAAAAVGRPAPNARGGLLRRAGDRQTGPGESAQIKWDGDSKPAVWQGHIVRVPTTVSHYYTAPALWAKPLSN
jgi:hypothetical protein